MPTAGLILRLVARLTTQVSLLELPLVIVEGVAVKLLMLGGDLLAPTITEPSVGAAP